ncbi:B-cell receptor CD22-like [Centroberyx affinis]|uniref:B-cell receptor CD22-like n=1 Tax=Centroberyx affinis TaxID=166261 RepID=UPI003A5BF7D4
MNLILVSDVFCVTVVQGQDDWGVTCTSTEICALKGSTVDILCTYRHPASIDDLPITVVKTLWFTKEDGHRPVDLRTDSEYEGRVEYHGDQKNCSLRITDLRETDSAVYKFRFITNHPNRKFTSPSGVTLTVTALQVLWVSGRRTSSQTRLKCHSSCYLAGRPSYIWYQNGQNIKGKTSSSYTGYVGAAHSYSCAVKGQEDFRSPSVYAPNLPSVLVSPSGEIVEGSSVTLTCRSDANPAATYTWYKENGNPDHKPFSTEPQLHFVSIQSSDSGEYYCAAENELGRNRAASTSINVKYGPKNTSVLLSPSGETVEGSSVTLICRSDANPAATYTWYKENGNPDHKPFSTEPQLHFVSIQSSDSGEYYCAAENELGRNRSAISINVKYGPKNTSVLVSPSGEIVQGSSVTLTCSSDANPAATYTWYKENRTLHEGPEESYNFTSISSEDSGTYHCQSENQYRQLNSSSVFIDVQYGPKNTSVSVSPSGEILEGSSVNLTCSSDANPAATYTWYKENEASLKASEQTFTMSDLRPEHSGNYSCEAHNRRGRHTSTLQLTVVEGPQKSTAPAVTSTLLLVIILLIFVFLWIRRKRTSKQPSEPGERPDNRLQARNLIFQTQPTEQQDDLDYATVHFSKMRPDPLYSNFKLQRRKEEEEETVQYAAVKFRRPQTAPGSQEADEDPSELYSTVQKPHTNPRF